MTQRESSDGSEVKTSSTCKQVVSLSDENPQDSIDDADCRNGCSCSNACACMRPLARPELLFSRLSFRMSELTPVRPALLYWLHSMLW